MIIPSAALQQELDAGERMLWSGRALPGLRIESGSLKQAAFAPNAHLSTSQDFAVRSARDEDGVDALQHHFAFLIVEVHLVADNAPIRIRLQLALL